MHGEIAKLTSKLVFLSQPMDGVELTFEYVCMSLDLLKDSSFRLSQKVDAWI